MKTVVSVMLITCLVFAGVCYFYELPEEYETVSLLTISDLLSDETRSENGVFYKIDDKVIYRPYNTKRPYTFLVVPLDRQLFPEGSTELSGNVSDLNRLTREITFVSKYNKANLAVDFGKGGVDAIVDLVMAPINIILHPIKFAKSIGSLTVAVWDGLKSLLLGRYDLDELKKSVTNFAEMYWYDLCSKKAKIHNLVYDSLVYPSSMSIIQNEAKAYLSGEVTTELVTLFLAFSKISKISKAGEVATGVDVSATVFENIKPIMAMEKIARFGVADEYLQAVNAGSKGVWITTRAKLANAAEQIQQFAYPAIEKATDTSSKYLAKISQAIKGEEGERLTKVVSKTEKAQQTAGMGQTENAVRALSGAEKTQERNVVIVASDAQEAKQAANIQKTEKLDRVADEGGKAKQVEETTKSEEITQIETQKAEEPQKVGEKSTEPGESQDSGTKPSQETSSELTPSRLPPNSTYTENGYTYTTDAQGRVVRVEGKLELNKGARNPQASQDVRQVGNEGDHAGHLIGNRFGGSGSHHNLQPQYSNVNQGAWKRMENEWEKALREGKEVEVDIQPQFSGDSPRPDSYIVNYRIGENFYTQNFPNP